MSTVCDVPCAAAAPDRSTVQASAALATIIAFFMIKFSFGIFPGMMIFRSGLQRYQG
jgi:hypothetical protein